MLAVLPGVPYGPFSRLHGLGPCRARARASARADPVVTGFGSPPVLRAGWWGEDVSRSRSHPPTESGRDSRAGQRRDRGVVPPTLSSHSN